MTDFADQRQNRAESARPRLRRSVLLSAIAGFVCGAVCWHLVGFWAFLAHEVFASRTAGSAVPTTWRGLASSRQANRQTSTSSAPSTATATADSAVRDGCTSAEIDRDRGTTRLGQCPPFSRLHASPQALARSDRADFSQASSAAAVGGSAGDRLPSAVAGWSARVDGPR
jgi:hypothetical protein